jgi:hypothetical protein
MAKHAIPKKAKATELELPKMVSSFRSEWINIKVQVKPHNPNTIRNSPIRFSILQMAERICSRYSNITIVWKRVEGKMREAKFPADGADQRRRVLTDATDGHRFFLKHTGG